MSTYGKLCTEFYDIDKPEPPPDAFEYYLVEAGRTEGAILEPMCGSGRFLLPLAARGFDVEGSDASSDMLTACREHARRLGLEPSLTQQRLDTLTANRKFGLIFIPSGSFCLITDATAALEGLRRIRELLAPSGRFIVEVELRNSERRTELSGTWGGRWVTRPDGAKLVLSWLSQYAAQTGISSSVHRYDLVKDGQLQAQEFEDFELKLYELSEFREMLERAGFTRIQALTPYTLEPISESSDPDDGAISRLLREGRDMTDPTSVTLEPATPSDAELIANLLELYIHDLSPIFPHVQLGPDGRFGYGKLSLYWSEPERRFAFLIRYGERIAGFILATRGSPASEDPDVLDVSEFFVLRQYRRSNVGRRAAYLLWQAIPGKWTVRVSEANAAAVTFWRRTVGDFSNGGATESQRPGEPHPWRVFFFDAAARSPT